MREGSYQNSIALIDLRKLTTYCFIRYYAHADMTSKRSPTGAAAAATGGLSGSQFILSTIPCNYSKSLSGAPFSSSSALPRKDKQVRVCKPLFDSKGGVSLVSRDDHQAQFFAFEQCDMLEQVRKGYGGGFKPSRKSSSADGRLNVSACKQLLQSSCVKN